MRDKYIGFLLLLICTPFAMEATLQPGVTINGIEFGGDFYIFYSPSDPEMELRPITIPEVQYNVITWEDELTSNSLAGVVRKNEQSGDGFDDSILDGDVSKRTADLFALSYAQKISPVAMRHENGNVDFIYEDDDRWSFSARIDSLDSRYPVLTFNFVSKVKGYFAILYAGTPSYTPNQTDELWQPMIWQERRVPDTPYLTAAFQCPVPTTLLSARGHTIGIVAAPSEFPFNPLPVLENSRFGVALKRGDGKLAPMIMAPVFGGYQSHMQSGSRYSFKSYIYVSDKDLSTAFEEIARNIYHFHDYRHNDIASLNENLYNTIDYALSSYSQFIDEQKGCCYSTDVPGAVKNVSSLDPLTLALVTDNRTLFEQRAYPIVEYQLSREKFLFCADSTQKIQSPSRKMDGPIAPISEMTSLYNMAGENMPFLLQLSKEMYGTDKNRNLDVVDRGDTWQNALWLYRASHDTTWLDLAREKADEYIACRIDTPAVDFSDPDCGGFFFWTGYTPKWIDLLELYEETRDPRYLKAAHQGARNYTRFVWFSPSIPHDSILVNKGGKAPLYWYLAQKGHRQMKCPEEMAPAWRLSEIGLTPESSGTCSGHRAIFMANYAPWFLRIANYTGDRFLADVARSAMIGRSRNFPGYHINTARTTVYEKADYPLHSHEELSVNSFHYNHIMPKAASMLDYLVTEAWSRSNRQISFPSTFIEGYAYLQTKSYGFRPGTFYGREARLWMPDGLLKEMHVELNYIAARDTSALMLALSNESNADIQQAVMLDESRVQWEKGQSYPVTIICGDSVSTSVMQNGCVQVTIPAGRLTALIIDGIKPVVDIQDDLLAPTDKWTNGYFVSRDDMVRALVLHFGKVAHNAYIYLTADDSIFDRVMLECNGQTYHDDTYPYEFTLPLNGVQKFSANVKALNKKGETIDLGEIILNK